MASASTLVTAVDGHRLRLSNLEKVLYPEDGFTKGEVLDYYARVADVLLPHLADRAVTRKRWPEGTAASPFFEKNLPRGTPSWVRTVRLDSPSSSKNRDEIVYPLIDDRAGLVWCANLAALELHVPQWRVSRRGTVRSPDRLVIDLDPGAPAALDECVQVALAVRERLAQDGLDALPVTSGSKGLQLYAAISGRQPAETVKAYARTIAQELEHEMPELVVSRMEKARRVGKVLIDWSQNDQGKTTVAPYSLRGRARPTAAAPHTVTELESGKVRHRLAGEVLERVEAHGDPLAPLFTTGPRVPTR